MRLADRYSVSYEFADSFVDKASYDLHPIELNLISSDTYLCVGTSVN